MSLASLQMYDLRELREANEDVWQGLASHLRRAGVGDVPERLSTEQPPDAVWRDPRLLFAQTCGYPLTHELAGVVTYLSTPGYDLPGCSGTDYCSFLVMRENETAANLPAFRGRRVAINGWNSHSGMNVLRAMVAPLAGGQPFFAATLVTGGHGQSLLALQKGEADLAAIDCVTWGLLARHRPAALAGLRILEISPAAPCLPYITGGSAPPDLVARLRDAIEATFRDSALATARDALALARVEVRREGDYARIPAMERQAARSGYPRLR